MVKLRVKVLWESTERGLRVVHVAGLGPVLQRWNYADRWVLDVRTDYSMIEVATLIADAVASR